MVILIKKKRFIRLKDSRLIRARTELRTLWALVWERQVSELYDQIRAISYNDSLDLNTKIQRKDKVRKQIKSLTSAYNKSPVGCRTCGNRDRDLTYVPALDTWYCEPCYTFNQDYYKRHPEEADWKELYP